MTLTKNSHIKIPIDTTMSQAVINGLKLPDTRKNTSIKAHEGSAALMRYVW